MGKTPTTRDEMLSVLMRGCRLDSASKIRNARIRDGEVFIDKVGELIEIERVAVPQLHSGAFQAGYENARLVEGAALSAVMGSCPKRLS